MMKCIKNNLSLVPFWIIFLLSVIWFIFMYDKGIERLFVTSDRLGYRHYQNQDYLNAAKHFEDISFKAASYYKAAEFKNAKALYQNLTTKEGVYNLGNTFVMLGDYDNAIQAYKRALKIDPNFEEAQENLLVAQVRKTLKEPGNDGQQGVGMMGADEIVYDNTKGKGVDDERSAQKDLGQGNPNWLDRLQTAPQEFLKNKFRYQYQMKENYNAD